MITKNRCKSPAMGICCHFSVLIGVMDTASEKKATFGGMRHGLPA